MLDPDPNEFLIRVDPWSAGPGQERSGAIEESEDR